MLIGRVNEIMGCAEYQVILSDFLLLTDIVQEWSMTSLQVMAWIIRFTKSLCSERARCYGSILS